MYSDEKDEILRESLCYESSYSNVSDIAESSEDPIDEYKELRLSFEQGTLAFYGLSWKDFY